MGLESIRSRPVPEHPAMLPVEEVVHIQRHVFAEIDIALSVPSGGRPDRRMVYEVIQSVGVERPQYHWIWLVVATAVKGLVGHDQTHEVTSKKEEYS